MKQFLIVKTSAIGDVIQSLYCVNFLKKRYPDCSIDWIAEKSVSSLLQAHPGINRVMIADTKLWRQSLIGHRKAIHLFRKELREKNYDALFDLQGNTKSGLITTLAKARKKVGYGWSCVPEKPNYFSTNVHLRVIQEGNMRYRYTQVLNGYFGEEELKLKPIFFNLTPSEHSRLQRFVQLGFQHPRIMVCFGSNWKNKQLEENTLKEFLRLIDEKYSPTFFFIFGNDQEKAVADRLERLYSHSSHAFGDMSLPLWQRCMHEVEMVISTDSAGLHLCGTTSTPSFSVFGPSSALAYKPLGEKHRAYQGTCPYEINFDKRCPNLRNCETGACLKELSASALFEQFQQFWNSVSTPQELTTV